MPLLNLITSVTFPGHCYTSLAPGTQRCRNKIPFKLSRLDCCCGEAVGVAWGEGKNDCEPCPKKGTGQHEELCKAAANVIDPSGKDACALRSDLCPNGKCVSSPDGGYTCKCDEGFATTPAGTGMLYIFYCNLYLKYVTQEHLYFEISF